VHGFIQKKKKKIAVHGPTGQEQLQVRLPFPNARVVGICPDHQAGELRPSRCMGANLSRSKKKSLLGLIVVPMKAVSGGHRPSRGRRSRFFN
jgi:hypothetical protein